MNSNVIFFTNKADKRVVNKSSYITRVDTLRGNFRNEIDLSYPIFTVKLDYVPNFNYCYIDSFDKYYYITKIKNLYNNLYEITCEIDVLMTYKSQILKSTQYVSRQESTYNEFLIDDMVTFKNDYAFTIYEEHLDFLDYASVDYSLTPASEGQTNIVISVTEDSVSFEI